MVIQTEKLTKCYGNSRGIEEINLSVKEGGIIGFSGPNGSGKTTVYYGWPDCLIASRSSQY